MAIHDKLQKVMDEYEKEVIVTPGDRVLEAAINLIPVAGSPIAALFCGKARQRVQERAAELFTEMKKELERVDEDAINKEFFETEEFQTLLALAMEQLQTTHNKEKLKLIAKALANSGLHEFDAESRKEVFVRALRDLTPAHISILSSLMPRQHPDFPGRWFTPVYPQQTTRDDISKLLTEYLVAIGFVAEVAADRNVLHEASRSGLSLTGKSVHGAKRSGIATPAGDTSAHEIGC